MNEQKSIEEMRAKNRELRKIAPLPPGTEVDFRERRFVNKYNSVEMKIVSHLVSDSGSVLWTSETGEYYTTREITKHWTTLDKESQEEE